ncbi:MAG: diguanylate cyclase, partial [Candidatus Binatia bacterium]
MPTRFGTASTPRRRADAGACVALAVYHASPDVRQHVAELARLRRFRVTCIPQRQVPARRPARVADAVLWELVPGKRPNRRRLAALARGVPLVSYSVSYSIDADRYLAELSHTAGFTTHLKAPLRPVEIDCQLALAQPTELSARLRMCRAPLGRHLARHDVLADVFRRVNASVEPARVAEVLAADVSRWLPVASWAVLVPDERHALRILASRGLASGLEPAALAFGGWTFRRGKESASANLACDRRTPVGPAVAAVAFPLVSRGRTVGVLVGLDAQPAERVPTMGPELVATLGMVVEPASIALDNALRLQRATSLSLTDDLTRLYNSRFLSVVLRRETKRTSRTGNPLSMLFVDLDGFKTINDRHGHLCG